MTEIYLISKLWINPMEEDSRDTTGYDIIGYVETLEEAEKICDAGQEFDVNDCWSITKPMPEYKYEKIKSVWN